MTAPDRFVTPSTSPLHRSGRPHMNLRRSTTNVLGFASGRHERGMGCRHERRLTTANRRAIFNPLCNFAIYTFAKHTLAICDGERPSNLGVPGEVLMAETFARNRWAALGKGIKASGLDLRLW